MRYALVVAYDGTNYCGWQVQPNGVTIQSNMLEAAYAAFKTDNVTICASGRTDSGVHAKGQVCHMDVETTIPPERIADAMNVYLPQDISVLSSHLAKDGFDANRSAKKKTYIYNMYFAPRRNPLKDRYSVFVKGTPNVQKMREAAELFEGEHDFKAYCASGSQVVTTVRIIYKLQVDEVIEGDICNISISVCGNGFLYNMVRTIAGTLLYYAMGRMSLDDIKKSLSTGDRNCVGKTMPPNGLILDSVLYD
jgi:tRNA pseudouridine38-40 synthase